jgi:2-polyprenyl-3-methyl-5-hydroxy-6-metoxy-1,4-benzoquinol methylase
MIRYIPYKLGGKLLEVGIGNGQYLLLMKELGWEVEGIEPDTEASKTAQEMGFKIQSCEVQDAQLNHNYYDAVILHHVTEHLPDPKNTLQKLISSLKVNGIIVSISPNPIGFISSVFQQYWYELDAPRHLVLPSPKGYNYMFLESNLTTKTWTTMQMSYWMYRESLSIKKNDSVGKQGDSIWLKIMSFYLKMLLFIKPECGEEVICVVTKQ